MKKITVLSLIVASVILSVAACKNASDKKKVEKKESKKQEKFAHPEWAKSANIYEVNIRQYTKSGTFKEFETHLPRLKKMGVDILWLMPIFEIGEKFRKATAKTLVEEIEDPKEREKYLGSYYGIKDYMAVNKEFGTMEDFKHLVEKIHELGMRVVLDIAVNHSAWDNDWVTSHPDYYSQINRDSLPWDKELMKEHPEYFKEITRLGITYPISPSVTDWWDTADLNYDSKDLRRAMIKVFKFWVEKCGIDGYRCDVAGYVPTDFWEEVRISLDSIKPIFMLAEAEEPAHHNRAFDGSYAWELHHIFNQIAQGKDKISALDKYLAKDAKRFPSDAYRMAFITNHDENSWNGTVAERMGDAYKAMAVLSYTLPGMPLIYSGQEVGLNKRLLFFEKDEIDWKTDTSLIAFYTQLNKLKTNNSALWNAQYGAALTRVATNDDEKIYAFVRKNDKNTVLVIANLSKTPVDCKLSTKDDFSKLTEYFSNKPFDANDLKLNAWEYKVFVK